MRGLDVSFLCSIFLLAGWTEASSLRGETNPTRVLQTRTDLIRLIPFQVQIAIRDETSARDSQKITETLYGGGTLLTDTIADWMTASFVTKTDNEQAEQLLVNNYTTFDSIALELVENSTSTGSIGGQELDLVQVTFEGVTLWERQGTGTPPMEPEIVELIQRATFLEDRTLKIDLQTTVNNLLFDLGIDSIDGVQPISIVDVRAYITPPGSSTGGDGQGDGQSPTPSNSNKNLETIIIVAIVVACLAFALLIFAVVWAWRADRQERNKEPSSSRPSSKKQKGSKTKPAKRKADPSTNGIPTINKKGPDDKPLSPTERQNNRSYVQAPSEPSVDPGSSYDLPNDGSYPSVVGNSDGGADSAAGYPADSVLSEDISSSLSAYYKSGMGYNKASRPSGNFNDAASMSSMDSYGYSLDGYAPSLGPAQGGYPVGPMQAARDAPIDVGTEEPDIKQLQDEESIVDYDSEPPKA